MERILVVDDEPDILQLISLCLSTKGYEVKTAKSKQEFFNLLISYTPDLIILDVMLGNDNGRDICKEIKAAQHKHIPIILYSAVPTFLDNYEECNADDILHKPFLLVDLYEKVNKALRSK
jgi:DNA-binding response OmpR family regulator